ncbi:MAG: CehA/McbA family metallohydrolase [Planctomycetaceae bacterium]
MKPKHLATALTIGLLSLVVAVPALRQANSHPVEAVWLDAENWKEYAPEGKEVDAIFGDIVLRNEHLTAVIAQPVDGRHANMTVREVGGGLIDFTTRRQPSDQLSAFYPGKRGAAYDQAAVTIRDAAGNLIRTLSAPEPNGGLLQGPMLTVEVTAPAVEMKPQVVTSYRLAANQEYLEVVTTFTNPHNSPVTMELEDDWRQDAGKEDLVRSPNGAGEFFWTYDRHWNQAYGLALDGSEHVPGQLLMNSDAKLSTLKYLTADGKSSATLATGESLTLTRRLFPAGDLLQLRAAAARTNGKPVHSARFVIKDGGGQPISRALVELIQPDGVFYGSACVNPEGTLETAVPEGNYAVHVSCLGNRLDDDSLTIDVRPEGNHFPLTFSDYRQGKLEVLITDEAGLPIPGKTSIRRVDRELAMVFGPETSDFGVKNLRYSPNGKFTQDLPAGIYEVGVSHGPEYDFNRLETLVRPGKTTIVNARLPRVVNTTGWVSADFHSHSSASGDNTSSQLGRVLNLVCEHIEFAPCTEHNRVDTYNAQIKQLGIESFLATVSGIEMTGTPLPLNHQNAFPMMLTPHTQDNGAPRALESMDDQIEQLALWDDRSEKLVQVNHPDIGWMFYDRNGDGKPDGGFERAFPFINVIEIHPIQQVLHLGPQFTHVNGKVAHNTVFNWLQLLNQGFRIYGVVNTDAHYNYHGSGSLRNWIQSSTDDPAKIDPQEMQLAAKEGRLVMSNGPFLQVAAAETGSANWVAMGQDLAAPSQQVSLKVRVQCPNWLDVDRVFLLVNGRASPQHQFSREKTPEVFHGGVVKFEQELTVTLTGDAHLIVAAGDDGGNLVSVMGPEMGNSEPAAVSNPIFVDVGGDGFQPNKDTLDAPLPVKFSAAK